MTQQGTKVVLVGDGGVGKTSFIKRYTTGEYLKTYVPTLGVKVVGLSDEEHGVGDARSVVAVWDTAGQEKFSGLKEGYYVGASYAMVMFDLANKRSFKSVPGWISKIYEMCGEIPIVICGNKADLPDRQVSSEVIDDFMKMTKSNVSYQEMSVKDNHGISEPLRFLKSNYGLKVRA